MVQKDFTAWHERKTFLSNRVHPRVFFHEGEIWWLSIGLNMGFEEDGKGSAFERPVLVVRKFNQNFFYGILLSTTQRMGPYYYRFRDRGDSALLSQMRAFDSRRLRNKEGVVSGYDLATVAGRLAELLTQPGK